MAHLVQDDQVQDQSRSRYKMMHKMINSKEENAQGGK